MLFDQDKNIISHNIRVSEMATFSNGFDNACLLSRSNKRRVKIAQILCLVLSSNITPLCSFVSPQPLVRPIRAGPLGARGIHSSFQR
ncbi:unnamed protein product [Leptosia nina]|uniref:Uncharacterized protein n=1 Tax=Leptosia nina TaxID=320188 RepID=A0AAV1JG84_9NEOP